MCVCVGDMFGSRICFIGFSFFGQSIFHFVSFDFVDRGLVFNHGGYIKQPCLLQYYIGLNVGCVLFG